MFEIGESITFTTTIGEISGKVKDYRVTGYGILIYVQLEDESFLNGCNIVRWRRNG